MGDGTRALPTVTLRGGPPHHPHVYEKRVLRMDRRVKSGDLVAIETREGRPCGFGFAHRSSLVAVRVLSRDPEVVPDEAWLGERVRLATELRRDVLRLPEVTNAWRALHAEGDGVSGLVVDRYGDVAVASLYSLGWYERRTELARVLAAGLGVSDVVFRSDTRTETHEGFTVEPSAGAALQRIHEHGLVFDVDPAGGHKTGFFVDQRDNRRFVAALAAGRRVFDGMTYTGGFALAAAQGGAAGVRGVDLDEEAIARARANARANDLSVDFDHGDVFDALRALRDRPAAARPDLLIVDPAKWAKARSGLAAALARYRDLNRLAFEVVAPGGIVCTSSCSGLVSESAFLEVVADAARLAERPARIFRLAGAAPDHPVATTYPEGRYLKTAFLAVD